LMIAAANTIDYSAHCQKGACATHVMLCVHVAAAVAACRRTSSTGAPRSPPTTGSGRWVIACFKPEAPCKGSESCMPLMRPVSYIEHTQTMMVHGARRCWPRPAGVAFLVFTDSPMCCCTHRFGLQARNAALRREKELMAWHYVQLKTTLDRGRAAAAERLKQLSVTSGTAMQVGVGHRSAALCWQRCLRTQCVGY
jgi:hypothetical protein